MAKAKTRVNKSKRKQRTRAGTANGAGTLVKRGNVYHARWMRAGKLVCRTTGTGDLEEARKILATMSVPSRGQGDRQALAKMMMIVSDTMADTDVKMQTIGIPVRDLFDLFSHAPNRHAVTPRTLEVYGGQLRVLDTWIQKRHPEIVSARDISQSIADEYIADRAKLASANTVNKDLNLFSLVWRTLARKYGLEYNPWTEEHIARKRLDNSTSRRALTPEEVQALLDNSSGEMHIMILLGVSTGLRMGDILNLTWDQLDMNRRLLTVRTRKTGAPVCLPILDDLYAALKAQREATDGRYVLPEHHAIGERSTSLVCRHVGYLFKRCGIKSHQDGAAGNKRKAPLATFHSLRHTFVTRLITRGVNPAIVREAVGHSTMLMTEHYTHIDAKTLQGALKG